jgi:uncharacterized membrane protein YdcZ (DUF606 family)
MLLLTTSELRVLEQLFYFCDEMRAAMKRISIAGMLLLLTQTSCIVAGYSNRGGWFLWPGGLLGILIVVAVILLLARRRS